MAHQRLVIDIRHPSYYTDQMNWNLWRNTYEGGDRYLYEYLQKFSTRETEAEYNTRRTITPIPAFAKAAVNDIRNAIFQRMRDVLRRDGSQAYQKAIEGLDGGVDMRGSNMTAFMGYQALTELLIMGRVGIYVDMPNLGATTLADAKNARPYLYLYPIEDILSWTQAKPDEPSEYQAVLLKDRCISYNEPGMFNITMPVDLPTGSYERYRLIYINAQTGLVNVQFFDSDGNPCDAHNFPTAGLAPYELELTKIPFVMLDIGESILKDVCKHQIALLNLGSSDVSYALKSNFPFYTEQRDLRAVGDHLKHSINPDGTATAGGQGASNQEVQIGVTQGRAYDLRADRPGFINPSPEPLAASIKLQEKLEDDIRKLVNLAVANKTGKAISAEARDMDNQGLEAGLSFIGLILENNERKIAEYWSAYEDKVVSRRAVPVIKYPDRYNLKTDITRLDEAKKLADLMFAVPGQTVKRELSRSIVASLLSGKVSIDVLEKIDREIDKAPYTTSTPEIILQAREQGIVGEKTASMALGFNDDEYIQAQKDHLARIERIAEAQSAGLGAAASAKGIIPGKNDNPAARGEPDLASDPAAQAKDEKTQSQDTTLEDTTKIKKRGAEK